MSDRTVLVAVFAALAGGFLSNALVSDAQAGAPVVVCEKFGPMVGGIPEDKVQTFMVEQLAAGRTNIEDVTSGAHGTFLVCAW